MAIKRFIADADTVITNAYLGNLQTVATGSNMGLADSLEVFHIYAQANALSEEVARTLIRFPVTDITTAIAANEMPAAGVSYI